jgi:hypothetical protein
VFHDHAGRCVELLDALERGVGVGDVVVRELLALQLPCRGDARLALAVLDPTTGRDGVVFGTPGYPVYESSALFAGGRAVPVVLERARGFRLDLAALPAAELDRTAIAWINYPHNPTGACVDRGYLRAQADCAAAHGILLASDECYQDLWFADEPPSSLLQERTAGVLAFLPGMPVSPVLAGAVGAGALAWHRSHPAPELAPAIDLSAAPVEQEEEPISASLAIDDIKIELGYGLLALINDLDGRKLTDQIRALRKTLAADYGFVMPPVRILDNMRLATQGYAIRIKEMECGAGEVRIGSLISGKFFAALAFLAVLLAFTLGLPITLANYGSLDWAPVIGAYVATLLLAGSYLAVGMFWSSLTRDQIVALLLALVSLLILYAFGFPRVAEWIAGFLPTWAVDLLGGISPYKYFESISRGVFDTRDVVYYLCFCGFFLHANALVLHYRRQKG